jgi:uncharacterized membrane protein
MSDDTPVDLYIAAYSDPDGAGRDWADLKQLEKDEMIKLDGLVLVSRDADGTIHVKEDTHDVRKGSVIGAVGGLVVGLIFPPALLASGLVGAGLGAGAGGLVSHYEKNEIKADVEEVLPPSSSGIVAVFEERWGDSVERALMNADLVKKEKVDRQSAEHVKAAAGATQSATAQ